MITNQIRKIKLLIIFDDLIGDMCSNKKHFVLKMLNYVIIKILS